MVDFVLLWVNGNDPIWLEDYARYASQQEGDKRIIRFRDWDNLKYLFRGIEKYAPWVRKVHFVTCGHIPDWLNLDAPKLHFVRHRDFIPNHCLPTFNCNPIELNLHRIEDLSEQFVYFNDDTFLIDFVPENRFFRNGLPCDMAALNVLQPSFSGIDHIQCNDIMLINKYFAKRDIIKYHFGKWFNLKYVSQWYRTAVLLPWHLHTGFVDPHMPNAYLKSTFEKIWELEYEILQKTPDMLPVLKKAGVVDAGGKGLLCVLTGAYKVLAGEEITQQPEASADFVAPAQTALSENISEEHDYDNIKFAYCTEYFVVNLKKHCTEEDVEKLRDKLMAIGDCVIVIGDISLIKVHVHTNQPNKALGYALQLGELDKVKIENMLQQHRAIVEERERNKKPLGMVAVCAGSGLSRIFKDMGVDYVIEGGQTMNPSVEDILVAVEKVNADNIIVLPNNKNIIMAADKVNELSEKNVSVVPTVSVAQGIRAAMAFDSEQDMSVNCTNMTNAYKDLSFGEVTHAVRNTNMDGFSLHEGDIIGISGDKIVAQSRDIGETTERVIQQLVGDFSETITLYYGSDVNKNDAEKLKGELA